jgi:hypothetical protein
MVLPRGCGIPKRSRTLRRVFTKGSRRIAGTYLRSLILAENLLPYECSECGCGPEWRGKELILQLDHRNGDPTDNRLENLRFLCPNCHSQTETWARGCRAIEMMGNGVIGNTPGFDPGDGHARGGSNPPSPAVAA